LILKVLSKPLCNIQRFPSILRLNANLTIKLDFLLTEFLPNL
jgi:hypothetical protein